MLTVVANIENSRTISIPADELEKLGFSDGEEVELSKENNEVILRSLAEAERKRKFENAKNEIFEEWNDVFTELAKGADGKSAKTKPGGKFVVLKTKNDKYEFILQNAQGEIVLKSSPYESKKRANDAVAAFKDLIYGANSGISNFPVESSLENA